MRITFFLITLLPYYAFSQTVVEKPVVDSIGIPTVYKKNNTFVMCMVNSQFRTIADVECKTFSTMKSLLKLIDTLNKYTTVENYNPTFEKAVIISTIDGVDYRFTLDKKAFTLNPNYDRDIKIYWTLSTKERKRVGMPNSTINEESIEMTFYLKNGWTYFRKDQLIYLKNKLLGVE